MGMTVLLCRRGKRDNTESTCTERYSEVAFLSWEVSRKPGNQVTKWHGEVLFLLQPLHLALGTDGLTRGLILKSQANKQIITIKS